MIAAYNSENLGFVFPEAKYSITSVTLNPKTTDPGFILTYQVSVFANEAAASENKGTVGTLYRTQEITAEEATSNVIQLAESFLASELQA